LDEVKVIAQTEASTLWREVESASESELPANSFLVNKSACETYAMAVALAIIGSFDAFTSEQKGRKRPRQD
jgi:hypothetical protein